MCEFFAVGHLHSTFEGYCLRKNERLEEATCLSAREENGPLSFLIVYPISEHVVLVLTEVFLSG